MKFEISPVEVSDLVPFSPPQNSHASKTAFAGVSKNGLWMWLVCDTAINIYHTENSEWFGGYCFGESLKNPSAKITAVTEFCSSHISFPCLLIAVNHDHESLICMYDINISKVFRAVLVPDKVFSLEVISGNGGVCMDTLHLFMQLRYMFGIVAVGTSNGHLYFLDLCLDEDFHCSEHLPNITFVLKKYELLPENREKAIEKKQHVFMLLNDQSVHDSCFEFQSRSSSLGHFPHGKVHVTALKYIQSTVSLAVGFSFGGIQLWGLQDLCLLYTVANQPQELPIISFAFQEPENDPRHFCYLWIIRGHSANERPEDFSVATMYALVYEKRVFVESFGYLYTGLRNCFKRFEYCMTSDPFSAAQSSSAAGSCLLSCQPVCQTDESHCLDVCSANESDTAPENISLCFLSWIVWSHSDNTPTSYHLALFDLNQWYRAEMPSSNLRSDPSDLNPYFAHFSLEEVAQIFDLEPLLGLYTIPHSIKKFKYISPSEEFFFPSSLDFQTMVFSTNGISKVTFMGLQKRLLYDIADMGPSVLVNPKEFYFNLIRCGLISDAHCASNRVPLIVKRETLMQLALEYHMPFFFMKCLKEWRYADTIQEGCTSRALLNWAWKKVIQIKSSIDKLNIPLFNCSGSDIDKAPLKCLHSYRRQLDLIDTIFTGYQKFAAPRTEQGIQELKCRKDVVFSINVYLQVVLWLRSVHVLPEVCEGEETEKNVFYPVNAVLNSYTKRRNQLQKVHSSIGPTDILIIDGLVKEAFSENTWQEKGGNGLYPPPSIYAALSCYLLDDVHLDFKHSLMYYLLLDICNASHNVKSPFISEVKKFPAVFGMSQSVSKLVKAFWHLDKFNFEVAIKKLLHPAVKASDVLPWQHDRAIKLFLYQGESRKALKYINRMEPPEITVGDMKLHMSVLLARGAIIQAFDYQRSKQSIGYGTELLNHLFLGCQEMHKLKDLMYMPLNTLESSALVTFLSENEDPRAQEALVMYYLLHCNFFEAAKVNEKLSMSTVGRSASARERTAGRDALVEGLLASVPKTERNLVDEINRFTSVPFRKTETLKPLSLSIKKVPMKQITYSDILNSLISEASSVMCAPYLDPQTPLKSVSRSCYENLPFLRPLLTPERTKISSEGIHSTPVTKRALTSPSADYSSPSKRSRLLDNAPFRTPLSKKKIPKHLVGDVASLLQSPPIPRRSSKHAKDVHVIDSSATAPQGILKKKVEPTRFPASDIYTSKTPSVLSDAGEDSNSEDDNEMIVDNAPEDIPGRQIRFSVPSKEDLNASVSSSVSIESSVSGISTGQSSFMKKLEVLKPIPSLEQFDPDSNKFVSVTRRKTLGLTREPLNTYPKLSERNVKLSYEKSSIETLTRSSISSQYSMQQKVTEQFTEISDSDSCQTIEDSGTKKDYKITSFRSSSPICASSAQSNSKVTELNLQPSLNISDSESPLNKSGSSSGNSSYNSASERSFTITPRRPLRDNSKNTSFSSATSMITAKEEENNQTLLGDEMGLDDNDDNNSVNSGNDEDVSIIGEIAVPAFANFAQLNEERAEEKCSIYHDIPDSERTTSQPVEKMYNQDVNIVFETEKCHSSSNVFLTNEASLDIEQIFDSHDQNRNIEQCNDNQNQMNWVEAELLTEPSHRTFANQITAAEAEPVCESSHSMFADQITEAEAEPVCEFSRGIFADQVIGAEAEPVYESSHRAFADQITRTEAEPVCESSHSTFADQITEAEAEPVYESSHRAFADQITRAEAEPVCESSHRAFADRITEAETEHSHSAFEDQHRVTEEDSDNQTVKTSGTEAASFAGSDHSASAVEISEEIRVDINEKLPVEEDNIKLRDVNSANEKLSDHVESQLDKSPENYASEMISFAKDVPVPDLPAYVPIKERISRSQQSVSGSSKYDDEEDDNYPSLLLQEQMEFKKYDELFENELLDTVRLPSVSHFSVKSAEKLESVEESSEAMETDKEVTENVSLSPPTLSPAKDFSEKLTERFDFLSKHSDFYENNKLYKETMNLLKESDVPQSFEFNVGKKSSRKTRTFVFKTKEKAKIETTAKSEELKSKTGEEPAATSKEFLESWHPETYEQFSYSIQKGISGSSDVDQRETLKSSPNAASEKSSLSLFYNSDTNDEQLTSETKGRKKQESSIKETSVDKRQKSSIRKAKDKGKTPKKMEFSFAEPHSPAGAEILEALTTTPGHNPVGSFMFSPPLTRGRLRKKRMDESLSSSFASVASDMSFTQAKKPPVDPILEEIMAERASESQKLIASASKSKVKAPTKKKATKTDVPRFDLLDASINTSSLVDTDSPGLSPSKVLSSTKNITKHKMVLRQAKAKSRTEQLF